MGMTVVDFLLIVVSIILICLVLLQDSRDTVQNAFSGEKSELFANKKERGMEVFITRATVVVSALFIILAFIATFIVDRGLLG